MPTIMERPLFEVYPVRPPKIASAATAMFSATHAGVVELVDTSDSKSDASNSVPVQVRPPVPAYSRKCDHFIFECSTVNFFLRK